MSANLYILAGEEAGIRAFVTTFYDQMVSDVMIGFFFRNADKARLIDKEVELISRMLGHSIRYTGRSIRKAHEAHPIMGGHFERRWMLLKNAMESHAVPAEVQELIEEHTRKLRPQVTTQKRVEPSNRLIVYRTEPDTESTS